MMAWREFFLGIILNSKVMKKVILIIFLGFNFPMLAQTRKMELKLNVISFLPKGGLGLAFENPIKKRQSFVISGAFGNQSMSDVSGDYKNYNTLLFEYRINSSTLEENNLVLFGGPYIRHKYIDWKRTNNSTSWLSFEPGSLNVEARSISGGLAAGIKAKLSQKLIVEFKGGLGYMNRYYIKDFYGDSYVDTETIDVVLGLSLGINLEAKNPKK
jgi:hypothetical protein